MLLLCTDSLKGYGLNRIFEFAQKAGYDGIDLAVDFGLFDTYNTEYIESLIEQYKMPVHAISAPKQIAEKRINEIVKLAKKLHTKIVVLQPPKILNFKLANWLRTEIPKLREKEQLSIALENAPAGTFLGFIPEHAMSNLNELKKFKHVALDTSRIGEQRDDLIRKYSSLRKYLVHVHLSNLHAGKKYHLLNEGILPLESFLTKLKQDGYPGALSIKIRPKLLHAGENDSEILDSLEKTKNFYQKYYANVETLEQEEVDEENNV